MALEQAFEQSFEEPTVSRELVAEQIAQVIPIREAEVSVQEPPRSPNEATIRYMAWYNDQGFGPVVFGSVRHRDEHGPYDVVDGNKVYKDHVPYEV